MELMLTGVRSQIQMALHKAAQKNENGSMNKNEMIGEQDMREGVSQVLDFASMHKNENGWINLV